MKEKIPRNVILLSIVSLLNDFSSEMIMPILPMFLVSLGASSVDIGILGGLRGLFSQIFKFPAGFLSDKLKRRKPFVFLGYFISGIFKFLLSFSTSIKAALSFASLERIGKSIRTSPRDALIAQSLPAKEGKVFGFHRAFDTLGAIGGVVGVLLLFWYLHLQLRTIILVASIISILSLIFILPLKEAPFQYQQLKGSLKELPSSIKKFIFVSFIFNIANFSYMFFILKSQVIFKPHFLIVGPILLYLVFNIFYSLFSYPVGLWADREDKRKVICIGYLLFSFVCFGFAISTSLFGFLCFFILYGIALSILEGVQRAYVASLIPSNIKATTLGIFHTFSGVGMLLASIIAGILWKMFPEYAFIFAGWLSYVSGLMMLMI